jgi:hypothetical protein
MFPLNTIIAWSINIIMNKKYDNNNIIIASRAYFLQHSGVISLQRTLGFIPILIVTRLGGFELSGSRFSIEVLP